MTIVANRLAGVFYGVQTLRHLLPPAIEYDAAFPEEKEKEKPEV